MTLQRKVAGISASELLAGSFGFSAGLGHRIAKAIVKVHRANVTPCKQHTIDDELRILDDALASAAQARPELSASIAQLAETCIDLAEPLRSRSTVCGIHRDFYPDQVLLAGARTYLLDFDLYCLGDPALDAGNFIAHVIDQSVRSFDGDSTYFALHQDEFLDACCALHGEQIRPAINIYTTLALARLVAISTRFTDRNAWTATLIDVVRQRLNQSCPVV
jgi:aminoglycoside phosphotransferase (APT) family kinase protein